MQRHTLIQTISRVNRVYPGKENGLVVDYIGIKSALNAALKQYATGGEEDCLETNEQALPLVKDELDILRGLFYGFDWQPFSQGKPLEQLDCLKLGTEFVQEKQLEARFLGHCRKLRYAFKLCSSSEELEYSDREDIHFFIAVRSILVKLSGKADAPDIEQMNSCVEKMISEALRSEGVEEILQIGEEEQLDLLSEAYMQRIERLPYPHTKVKLMERLLKQVIKGFRRVNKFKALDFTKRLNDLIARYNDRRDNAVFAEEVVNEVAQQMSDMLRDLHTEKNSFVKLGISYEEKAFYDILKAIAQQSGFEYPEEKLLLLSARIKDLIDDKSNYTDWSTRGDIKAELEMDLIVLLSEYGYPPVPNDAVFKEILEQAENFKQQ